MNNFVYFTDNRMICGCKGSDTFLLRRSIGYFDLVLSSRTLNFLKIEAERFEIRYQHYEYHNRLLKDN